MGAENQLLSTTERTRLRRHAERARTDRADLYAVLDAGMICHFGVIMNGSPVVLPTAYGRIGDTLYLHGSSANRSIAAAAGQAVCVTVTHIDGLVCARSIFAHSVNYRSAAVFGVARLVEDHAERLAALQAIAEQVIPGRWDAVRTPSRKELAATAVLAVPLAEASVKVRSGPPIDETVDASSGAWAGVVPIAVTFAPPEPDPEQPAETPVPEHIAALIRRFRGARGRRDGLELPGHPLGWGNDRPASVDRL
jgi:nitroimidazol reductase NimA-like FMN-containing flavoprotein (pyridoxamine 5'-phosphate oxidase superfamily)